MAETFEADSWSVGAVSAGRVEVMLVHPCGCCSTSISLSTKGASAMIDELAFGMRHAEAIRAGQSGHQGGTG